MQGIMWIVFFFIILILCILAVDLVKKNRRKYLSVVVVIILVLFGIFFGLSGENRYYEYFYIIELEPNDLSNYEFYFPVALDAANQPHELMDDIDVQGKNADVDIIETIHGKALRVAGSGNIKIYAELLDGKTTFYGDPLEYAPIFHLSMYDHTQASIDYHWLYYNNSKRFSVDIKFSSTREQGKSEGRIITMPWPETAEGVILDNEYTQLDTGWFLVGFKHKDVDKS